jgi:hypothetical protein
VVLLALAAIYVAAARFGFTMAYTADQVTLVWPPTGLSLAALVILGVDVWPGVFLGAFIANVTSHEPVLVASRSPREHPRSRRRLVCRPAPHRNGPLDQLASICARAGRGRRS